MRVNERARAARCAYRDLGAQRTLARPLNCSRNGRRESGPEARGRHEPYQARAAAAQAPSRPLVRRHHDAGARHRRDDGDVLSVPPDSAAAAAGAGAREAREPRGPGPKGGGLQDVGLRDPAAQFSYPMFRDLEREQTGFTGIAAYVDFLANLSFDDRPMSGRGYLVSGSFFGVLNLRPALGRFIGPDDAPRVGESAVAVLSYEFWQRGLGGDPAVIGKTLTVNGNSLEIVGVAPQGFRGTNVGVRADVFVPLTLAPIAMPGLTGPYIFEETARQAYWIYLFARLKPGVALDRAAAQLNGVYSGILNDVEAPQVNVQQLRGGSLEDFRARQIEFSPGAQGRSVLAGTAARPLTLLLGVTAIVLLIVCVNIANLLLAR